MKFTAGIYRISNDVDGRGYIGSAVDVMLRWRAHRGGLRSGRHHNRALQTAWSAHGPSAFRLEILEDLDGADEERLLAAERRWVAAAEPGTLYNSNPAGVHRASLRGRPGRVAAEPRRPRRIVCHLAALLRARTMSLLALQRRTGLRYASLHALYQNQSTRYDEKTLDAICTALGCSVGDILEHVPD